MTTFHQPGRQLRQYHVGLVCWVGNAAGTADEIGRLEHAMSHVAAQVACGADHVFLPRDESSVWAWLPLGIRDTFDSAAASPAGLEGDVHIHARLRDTCCSSCIWEAAAS